MTESLSQRVQAVLENKGAQTRYSLSDLLSLYKLYLCLIYLCFNKLLDIYPFVEYIKQTLIVNSLSAAPILHFVSTDTSLVLWLTFGRWVVSL